MPSYSGVWNLTQQLQAVAAGNWPAPPLSGDIGLFAGGDTSGAGLINAISYVLIASTGNAQDFGDLTTSRNKIGACSSSARGLFGGGGDTPVNTIDYVTIATTGNATDFGDLTVSRYALGSCSSTTRGLFAGGYADAGQSNVIDYVTIATTGNATDFGDLPTYVTSGIMFIAACSNSHGGL